MKKTPGVGSCNEDEGGEGAQGSTERIYRREKTAGRIRRCSEQRHKDDVEMQEMEKVNRG